MALDSSRLVAELDSMIADLPATVTFGDLTFDAAASTATVGADINEGGFLPSRDITLNVKSTAATRKVKVGSKVSVSTAGVSTDYRVISVERSQDGNELIFSCLSHRR